MYSSVGIAARYGLDGPRIQSRWGRNFPHASRPALGPTQPPVQWIPGLSRGVKRPGRDADHPPPAKCRGQERVELYKQYLNIYLACMKMSVLFEMDTTKTLLPSSPLYHAHNINH